MNRDLNPTHDPQLRSWISSANQPGTDFPIQNLPFGVFQRRDQPQESRIGVAIGDRILDLHQCYRSGHLQNLPEVLQQACAESSLNPLMALGPWSVAMLRPLLQNLLRADCPPPRLSEDLLLQDLQVEMQIPATIGDYTDFYASLFHATHVGSLLRPHNPLLPNYKHLPIAYHGRSSSLLLSGRPIPRPQGQRKGADEPYPHFGATQALDYEMEVGFLVGQGNALGKPIPIAQAESAIFGLCLVNDWSARDIQAWEYQPLGPFLGKSFATSLSPWVVTLEAIAPFRCPAFTRLAEDPPLLPYLSCFDNAKQGGIDLTVEVWLQSALMKDQGIQALRLSQANFQDMYWTLAQMVAHHTSNGCNLRSGDLLASGTISGAEEGSQGSLLEITRRGAQPFELPSGEQRRFLQDGDEITLRGYCRRAGYVDIGLGLCQAQITASI
ncbi:fumarylacetoacetase [Lyngbya confervoides]|uniref:fumarylacetoacetase n=1 Tax=Lyngbya confervoides BDU141951 TaxID=1574623 RepID=A0ABD4SZH2_9CYAN|nr:fumarylacetoacetase [Lyngbya confervoides]MCM1981712.1 fumarylacetoacetase [Lyngbya confervoides BDU141951]